MMVARSTKSTKWKTILFLVIVICVFANKAAEAYGSFEKSDSDYDGWTYDEATGKWEYTGTGSTGSKDSTTGKDTDVKSGAGVAYENQAQQNLTVSNTTRKFIEILPDSTLDVQGISVVLWPSEESGLPYLCDQVAQVANATGTIVLCPLQEEVATSNVKDGAADSKGESSKGESSTGHCWRAFENYSYCATDSGDVDFIEALIELKTTEYSLVDPKVIVAGFSNGGSMAYRFYCEKSEMVDALVVVGAAWFDPVVGFYDYENSRVPPGEAQCAPTNDMPVFSAIGRLDNYYGESVQTEGFEGLENWHRFSTEVLKCAENQTTSMDTSFDLNSDSPRGACHFYQNCSMTEGTSNQFCSINEMGHESWFVGPFLEYSIAEAFPNITVNRSIYTAPGESAGKGIQEKNLESSGVPLAGMKTHLLACVLAIACVALFV